MNIVTAEVLVASPGRNFVTMCRGLSREAARPPANRPRGGATHDWSPRFSEAWSTREPAGSSTLCG
jgi:hypothetical protein